MLPCFWQKANSFLGTALFVQKYYFMFVKLCYFWHFVYIPLKKREQIICFYDKLPTRKSLKLQFEIVSLPAFLLYADMRLNEFFIVKK